MNKQLEQLKNIIMKYYKKERKEVFLKQLEKNFILKYIGVFKISQNI